jgi:hypothetical protein
MLKWNSVNHACSIRGKMSIWFTHSILSQVELVKPAARTIRDESCGALFTHAMQPSGQSLNWARVDHCPGYLSKDIIYIYIYTYIYIHTHSNRMVLGFTDNNVYLHYR